MNLDIRDIAPLHIREISPYTPGKPISELERELGISGIVKLASNENPLGPSPLGLAAAREAMLEVARYPDGNGFELKWAIADRFGVKTNSIVLGNGSNDVLEIAARAFLTPERSAVYSQYAFAVYPLAVRAIGARGIETPARAFGHDLEAMLDAVSEDTRLVFIANPNNPTGTLLLETEIVSFLERIPPRVLVVLDEAYTEYLPPKLQTDSIALLARFPNLILTRTFSKAFGLAGFRVGYALAHPDVADIMNRVRQPFNVSGIALAAARAALGDHEFLAQSFELNLFERERIARGIAALGLECIPSHGNFVSFRIPHAQSVYQKLLRLGVIVRPIANYEMPEHLRVSVGLGEENDKFLTALDRITGESS